MSLYSIQLNLAQLQMDMSRLPQHGEDELQAFLKLLCLNAIVLKSQVPKKIIEIWSILIKEEKIELLSKVKEETIELPNKGKEVLQIVKEETLELPKTKNHQDENIIAYIENIYKESFNKFIHFEWIAKLVVPIIGSSAKPVG